MIMDLEQFGSQLGLDETARNVLMGLPEDLQVEVLKSFNAEGSSNVSARFVSFCKKLTGTRREDELFRQDEEQIAQFVAQWELDDRAQKLLEGAKQEVRDYVYANFLPTAKTENVNKLFTSFIKKAMDANATHTAKLSDKRISTSGIPLLDRVSDRGLDRRRESAILESRITSTPRADLTEMANFIRRYKLDYEASALLLDLKESIRGDVMDSFSPPDQDEYSKLFTGFAISRIRGAPKTSDRDRGSRREEVPRRRELGLKRERDDDISDFVERWNLDEDCREVLRNMTSTLRSDVIRDFNPPADVINVNKSFTGFARSRGAKTEDRSYKRNRQEKTEREERTSSRNVSERVSLSDMEQFILTHGLDAKCQEVLLALPSRVQAECVATFEGCKEGNVNKLFMGFAKMKRETADRR